MSRFETLHLPVEKSLVAADGSHVRVLLGLDGGGMAHFELAGGATSCAVVHRSVEEIWYILCGSGQMWRKQGHREEISDLEAGICLTIPVGTQFQFRAHSCAPLSVVAITMPPWPGDDEAIAVTGPWHATEDEKVKR